LDHRVLIYGINYAPEIAGVGRYTGEIGSYLAGLGPRVDVVTAAPHYPGWRTRAPYSARRWTHERLDGADIHRCPIYLHPAMRGFRRLLAPLSFALSSAPVALLQALRSRPTVVLAVEPTLFTAPLALLAAKLVGAKTVLHVQDLEIDAAFAMGHLANGVLGKIARHWERLVLRRFDRVITISRRMAEKLESKGVAPARISVVRNWVDLSLVRPMATSLAYRSRLGLQAEDFVVLYSGNIGAKQGVRVLSEAARLLIAEPGLVIAVAGQGPLRSDLEAAAREMPNLRLYDFQPEATFGEFLSVANVHVLPQERDAADLMLPSKLGGMLASGRPIVVTADAETELGEFLEGSCELIPPGDAAALADAIRKLRTEAPCHLREASRLRLAASLSKETGIRQFIRTALFLQGDALDAEPEQQAA
jgi:colanic acid biosynthesis glycosyl transferase WcaI